MNRWNAVELKLDRLLYRVEAVGNNMKQARKGLNDATKSMKEFVGSGVLVGAVIGSVLFFIMAVSV